MNLKLIFAIALLSMVISLIALFLQGDASEKNYDIFKCGQYFMPYAIPHHKKLNYAAPQIVNYDRYHLIFPLPANARLVRLSSAKVDSLKNEVVYTLTKNYSQEKIYEDVLYISESLINDTTRTPDKRKIDIRIETSKALLEYFTEQTGCDLSETFKLNDMSMIFEYPCDIPIPPPVGIG